MARLSGRTFRAPQCAKCNRAGAMHSPYSDRYLCASCLNFERTVANAQAAQQAAEQAEQQRSSEIALDNARRYTEQAADCAAQAEQLPEPHKGWANSNAALFAEKATFYRSQAAQIASR